MSVYSRDQVDGASSFASSISDDSDYSTGMSSVYTEELSVFGDSGYNINMLFDDGVPQFDDSSSSSSMSYEAQRQMIFGSSSTSISLSVMSESHSSRLSVTSNDVSNHENGSIGDVSSLEDVPVERSLSPFEFYGFWQVRGFFPYDSDSSESSHSVNLHDLDDSSADFADDESSHPSFMSV